VELNIGQRLALNIDMHVILDAGAGTGKTQSIIGRIIEHYLSIDQRATRLLPAGPRPAPLPGGALRIGLAEREDLTAWGGLLPSEVVVLTFTTRAAEEMKHRLWFELNRLRPGPTSDDGGARRDSRITQEGLIDQLAEMLEDAPIGTIDSFLARLVAPWRADLSERPTNDVIDPSTRLVLIGRALDMLWRLRTVDDALNVGVDGERASNLIAARNRLARRFSKRSSMRTVLSSLISNRVFVDSVARRIEHNQSITSDNIRDLIDDLLIPLDDQLNTFIGQIHSACENWLNLARTNGAPLDLVSGLIDGSRFQALVELIDRGPPATRWDRWLWTHALCSVTVSASSRLSRKASSFSNGNLTSSQEWPRFIQTWGRVKDKETKKQATTLGELIANIWSSEIGYTIRSVANSIHLLDDSSFPIPHLPTDSKLNPIRMTSPLPYHPPSGDRSFGIEEETSHISDMLLCQRSLLDIFHELKVREGVHEFDDVASLAGDLLLAQCPRIMRSRYPVEVVNALDALPLDVWRDDHIQIALSIMDKFCEKPTEAAKSLNELELLRLDLQSRYSRLQEIRAQYRAFIIDEAQDNSALQWRLLGRLWGERTLPSNHPRPETPWEPTVCCVGDRKQSIYAFRQAQVSSFADFSKMLRLTNNHEFSSIPALTQSPPLRRLDAARDPRYVADGGFQTASDIPESRVNSKGAWVKFEESQDGNPVPVEVQIARSEGHVELVVNYRTANDLLTRLNGWWENIFSHHHDKFPGDWYARPQALISSRSEVAGEFEWLLPARIPTTEHPDSNLMNPLDPFTHGSSAEMENALITARIRTLLDESSYSPSDIMILLPSRTNLPDLMARLSAAGIPAQADKEGGLLSRAVVSSLLSLVQWIARPSSRHAASAVARSCLVGLTDTQLQEFIGSSSTGENLINRLSTLLEEGPHQNLINRWQYFSSKGDVIKALQVTLDYSDLFLAYPELSNRQDAEQFIQLVESQVTEVGGDPILLADRVAHLSEVAGKDLTSKGVAISDAIQIMTIHGSKGLQARCVIVGGLFSEGQTTIVQNTRKRVLATPGIFAANPSPWLTGEEVSSGVWNISKMVQQAQTQAEARRLFYVACTRVKDLLILAGAPNNSTLTDNGIVVKPNPTSMPSFGHMWFESQNWELDDNGEFLIAPSSMSFPIYHHVSQLNNPQIPSSPLVRLNRLDEASRLAYKDVKHNATVSIPSRQRRTRISPSALDAAATCLCQHWLSTRAGISFQKIQLEISEQTPANTAAQRVGLPPANIIGSIFHRLVEVGLQNPGPSSELTAPLSEEWTNKSPNFLNESKTIEMVLEELLPHEFEPEAIKSLMVNMTEKLLSGPIGALSRGESWQGEIVEGLRTEWPFNVRHTIDINLNDSTWTPRGNRDLATIESVIISSSGIADLVICSRLESGKGAIRAVDLKTTGAAHLYAGWDHPLFDAEGEERHHEEEKLLDKYRMQLALYSRTLQLQENSRLEQGFPSREVLPPAILCSATGRIITMTIQEMESALSDLQKLLHEIAILSLCDADEGPPSCTCGGCALELENLFILNKD